MLDNFDRPLRKLIAMTDDALVAAWLERLRRGETTASVRRRPPPDICHQPVDLAIKTETRAT
jgi:hypothetical protein